MDQTLEDPLVGRVIDGRYRVDARIAAGGMATVYRAVDLRLDRVLALKVMHPQLAADAGFVDRFIREAKSVARLAHPNVVAVFDQGADGPFVYLAMEYVSGCTLRDVLRERGALRPRAALDILEPVLAALGAAHRAGFVHRDMKPENVLIGDDGRVKVADFGLVRSVDANTNTTGSVLGTVSYLAPEQIEHGTVDARADVYACGVVLFEMLTGGKPHSGGNPAQILYRHLHEDVPAPSTLVPGLAPALDTLVSLATARDPRGRPADAAGLLGRSIEARSRLSEQELDADPPAARAESHAGSEDRTGVIPRPIAAGPVGVGPGGDAEARTGVLPRIPAEGPGHGREHTSRLSSLPVESYGADHARPPARPRGRGPSRGVWAVIVALVLIVGGGAGVWYISSGQFTRVPHLLNKTEAEAGKALDASGLGVNRIDRKYSDSFPRGTVMETDPAGGARIRGNGSITLVISRGPETVAVPDLKGMTLDQAKAALKKAGLAAGVVSDAFSEELPKGSVVSSDPRGGAMKAPDSAVALVLSKGKPVPVPNVVGQQPDQAKAALEALGLKVTVAPEQVESAQPAGAVAVQDPAADAQAAAGDTVTLTVSKGPKQVPVPSVTGQKVDDARKVLEAAGFTVKVDRPLLSFSDTVDAQNPVAGQSAPQGSQVVIRTKTL
ncbi:Stk1 family PASTA domain-containing Ser/Thr kinase [Streptomyces sp. BI20]|uniref:Stk1 family PASTA domain-containing Ser/Thr kinase n=1 Tax=Streptomyces sp. BI20 TaxID=3403460 RepID=UPI003C7736CB